MSDKVMHAISRKEPHPDALKCDDRPTVSGEVNKTGALLSRALDVADTLLSKVNGPEPAACGTGPLPHCEGLFNVAAENHQKAVHLRERLEELARAIG